MTPGSVVPPGRLIPAKQLWGGNPVSFIKDLDVGECWSNYTRSYLECAMGDIYIGEFTSWNSSYLERDSTTNDAQPNEHEMKGQTTVRDYFKGVVKYYC